MLLKRGAYGKKLSLAPSDIFLQMKYRECVLERKHLVHARQITAEERVIASDNLGTFYRFVNKRVANRSNVGVIIQDTGHILYLSGSLDKANAFNKYFSACLGGSVG